MAKLTVNIGQSANDRQGDNLRTAFDKINKNFDELYASGLANAVDSADIENTPALSGYLTSLDGDHKGNFFADDSTLIIDGTTGTISYTRLTDTPTIPSDVADLTDNTNLLSGSGNIKIGADDSSIRILNNGESFLIKGGQNVTTSSDDEGNIIVNGPDLSTYLQDGDSFDVRGSVFADDSTLLVDGVSGTIPSANLQGDLPDAVTIDGTAIKRKINTISTALAVGLS